jgi:hypothetical protein
MQASDIIDSYDEDLEMEVDDRDLAHAPETRGDGPRGASVERVLFAAHELHGAPVHQVNRGDNHSEGSVRRMG